MGLTGDGRGGAYQDALLRQVVYQGAREDRPERPARFDRAACVAAYGLAEVLGLVASITCSSEPGPTATSPIKGRSWARIMRTDAATPVAKSVIVIAAVSRLSICTIAMATSAQ